jgi:oxaloacetate decarboxylase alpha subunit
VAEVEIVDQTLRDGQQALWGMRMRVGHMLPVAADIDRVGYRVVDLTGSSIFEVLVRHCRENPWEGLDLISAAMPHSTLRAGTRPNGVVGMGRTPDAIVDLWVRTLARHGIGSLWIFDCLFNLDLMQRVAGVAAQEGMRVSPQVMFGHSPVHTDEYFRERVAAMAGWANLDSIILGDEAGVLTPERAHTFVPAMVAAAGNVPVELHFHNTTGLNSLNVLTGVDAGARIVHTATAALANGPSMPSTPTTVDNLRRLGHTVNIDDARLPAVDEHFRRVAAAEDLPLGQPAEYRVAVYEQQLPGGMTGTLRNQLAEVGMSDRLPAVLAEVEVVRREMGYPIMATPFSQLVGIQALLNVVNGKRYSVIPDENLLYLAGHLGTPPGPIDQQVLDRAFGDARGQRVKDNPPEQPTLHEIRHRLGDTLSDEELLLRYLMPGPDVDAMYAAGPVVRELPTLSENVRRLREIMDATPGRHVHVQHGNFSVTLRR